MLSLRGLLSGCDGASLAAVLSFAALACACGPREASVEPIKGPAGESGWFAVTCPRGRTQCSQLAADSCPKGYDVIDLRGDNGQNSSPSAMEGATGAPGNGKMTVSCK
jgi:hypothetical protein